MIVILSISTFQYWSCFFPWNFHGTIFFIVANLEFTVNWSGLISKKEKGNLERKNLDKKMYEIYVPHLSGNIKIFIIQ